MPNFIPNTPISYSPSKGKPWRSKYPTTIETYREVNINRVWYFNPWTGTKRHIEDIKSDPFGELVIPPNVQLVAAK